MAYKVAESVLRIGRSIHIAAGCGDLIYLAAKPIIDCTNHEPKNP
jgi:hypothetical protein